MDLPPAYRRYGDCGCSYRLHAFLTADGRRVQHERIVVCELHRQETNREAADAMEGQLELLQA